MRTQKLLKLRKARQKETLRRFTNKWRRFSLIEGSNYYILYRLRGGGADYQYLCVWWQ